LPNIEEDGKSWLRRPKLYKGVVEPYKKKKKIVFCVTNNCFWSLVFMKCTLKLIFILKDLVFFAR